MQDWSWGGYGALSKYLFSGKSKPGADPDASGEQGAGGLYYFGARHYDPTIGRWLSTDPVPGGKPAGSGQFHSPYVYAGNNPLVMVDPDGEWANLVFGAVINIILNAQHIDNFGEFLGYAAIGAAGGGMSLLGTPANWALNTVIGAAQGSLTGGFNASLTAGNFSSFNTGFSNGAVWGGAGGFLSSEAPQNFLRGDGFMNNEMLFDSWMSEGNHQRIIDRFGFKKGSYDPNNEFFSSNPTARAGTDPLKGTTTYGDLAFESYTEFRTASFHELQHTLQFRQGRLQKITDPKSPDFVKKLGYDPVIYNKLQAEAFIAD